MPTTITAPKKTNTTPTASKANTPPAPATSVVKSALTPLLKSDGTVIPLESKAQSWAEQIKRFSVHAPDGKEVAVLYEQGSSLDFYKSSDWTVDDKVIFTAVVLALLSPSTRPGIGALAHFSENIKEYTKRTAVVRLEVQGVKGFEIIMDSIANIAQAHKSLGDWYRSQTNRFPVRPSRIKRNKKTGDDAAPKYSLIF